MMGLIKRILFKKEIKDKSEWYNNNMSCETNESLHLHWKNIRLEFGKRDWENFCKIMVMAYAEWVRWERPELKKDNINENTLYLPSPQNIEPVSEFYPTRFQIEEQDNVPTIHIHYRELRLEFGIEEFKEFAEGVKKASEELNGIKN